MIFCPMVYLSVYLSGHEEAVAAPDLVLIAMTRTIVMIPEMGNNTEANLEVDPGTGSKFS